MPVAELRRFLPVRGGRFSAAAKTPGHGIPPDLPNKIIPVSFYPLKPKEGAPPPPGFNRDAVELLIVESKEQRRARDIARHVPCAGAVLREHYTSPEIDFRPRVTVACGPKVSPKETARTDFGSLVFWPDLIFLADTGIGGLLSAAKGKLESGRKITRLELVQALVGPRDLRNLGPGAAPALPGLRFRPCALGSGRLARAVAAEAMKPYSRSFTPEAWKMVIRGTSMEEYVDDYDLRIIEGTKADLALNLLKNGCPRQLIIESFGVTDRWLQELEERLKGGPAPG